MNRATFVLPALMLTLVGPSVGGLLHQQSSPKIAQAVPIRNGWGLALEVGQPFYQVGDLLEASFSVTNFSPQDTYGFALVRGGNGCTYDFTIEDVSGNVVWEPGSIVNGMFQSPGCSFAMTYWDFSSGTQERRENMIPLVYQNRDLIGGQGDPLPDGLYKLRVHVFAAGPQMELFGTELGFGLEASVPFRIVP